MESIAGAYEECLLPLVLSASVKVEGFSERAAYLFLYLKGAFADQMFLLCFLSGNDSLTSAK